MNFAFKELRREIKRLNRTHPESNLLRTGVVLHYGPDYPPLAFDLRVCEGADALAVAEDISREVRSEDEPAAPEPDQSGEGGPDGTAAVQAAARATEAVVEVLLHERLAMSSTDRNSLEQSLRSLRSIAGGELPPEPDQSGEAAPFAVHSPRLLAEQLGSLLADSSISGQKRVQLEAAESVLRSLGDYTVPRG